MTRHIRSSDPRVLTRKCCDRVRSVGAYWVVSQRALCSPELFTESEGFLVVDEPWGAFPGPQRASYGFSDGGRIAGGQ